MQVSKTTRTMVPWAIPSSCQFVQRSSRKLGISRQHHGDRLVDDDHRTRVAAELRILGKSKRSEKGLRLRQVGDREIETYLFDHGRRCSILASTNDPSGFGQIATILFHGTTATPPAQGNAPSLRGHATERPPELLHASGSLISGCGGSASTNPVRGFVQSECEPCYALALSTLRRICTDWANSSDVAVSGGSSRITLPPADGTRSPASRSAAT